MHQQALAYTISGYFIQVKQLRLMDTVTVKVQSVHRVTFNASLLIQYLGFYILLLGNHPNHYLLLHFRKSL